MKRDEVPPPEAVLTKSELAVQLKISERQVERQDFPTVYLGDRTPRYVWRQVLETLERRAIR